MKLTTSVALILGLALTGSLAIAKDKKHNKKHHSSNHNTVIVHNTVYRDHHRGHSYYSHHDYSHPYYYNGYYYSSPWWHTPSPVIVDTSPPLVLDVTCSPETITKNTTASEAVLVGLAQNELASSEIFKMKVADLQKMTGSAKVEEGFRLVGIQNTQSATEVLSVIYAREISPATTTRVAANLNLTDAQANLVITTMTQALKQK